MRTNYAKKVIYPTTIQDIQNHATKQIGRKLTNDELDTAIKCVEWGLSSVIDITLTSAIAEAVEKTNNRPYGRAD